MQTRRVDGKVRSEHIASLGSVDADVSVRERLAFWAKLPERLARLGNRVGPEEHAKIYGALHARIPMVTAEEQRAVQEENFKDDERFWDTMRDLNASHIEGHKALIARGRGEDRRDTEPEVAKAAEKVEVARSRLESSARRERQRRLGQKVRRCRRNEGGGHDAERPATHAALRQPDGGGVRGAARAGADEAADRRGGQGRQSRGAPDYTGAAFVRAPWPVKWTPRPQSPRKKLM